MVGRGRNYGRGLLGGVAAIGAAIAALHLLQIDGQRPATPSLAAGGESSCTVEAAVTACTASAQTRPNPGTTPPKHFRDGSYVAQGHYLTPGGAEAIGVRLTISADRVVGSQVEVEATSPTARQFQRQFSTRFAPAVMSKDVESVAVTRVAGASLTSLGFDNALADIRSQARVQA